jgi:hypothetical protein
MILENQSFNKSCTERTPVPKTKRFPGEDCVDNSDCFIKQNCTNKKVCEGIPADGLCTVDQDCNKGLYCNTTNCVAQLIKGAKCTKSTNCINSNACWNLICTEYYSLAAGSLVDTSLTDIANPETLCKYGEISTDKKCNEVKYGEGMVKDSSANLVACNVTDTTPCVYINTDNSTFKSACECAFNEAGSSWCKAASSGDKDFTNYYQSLKDQYVNTCHTLSRSDCYETSSKKISSTRSYSLSSVYRHKFYKAPACVLSVLGGSSNYVVFSMIFSLISVFAYLM